MANINLNMRDRISGKDTLVCMSMDEANQLYKALATVFGDIQFGAKPMELITVPRIEFQIDLKDRKQPCT